MLTGLDTSLNSVNLVNLDQNDRFSENAPSELLTFLSLRIDPFTQVALDLGSVQEVFTLSLDALTLMPNMPAFVLGLTYHRNKLIWAVDLGHFLGILSQRSPLAEYTVAIVFAQDTPIAFLVQSIGSLLRVSADRIRSVPDFLQPPEIISTCAQGFLGEVENPIFLLQGDALIRTLLQVAQPQS